MVDRLRRTTSFALAASLTRAGVAGLRAKAPGGRGRWERKNHSGRSVELYAGLAVAVAAAVGAGLVRSGAGAGLAAVTVGAAAAVLPDDLAERTMLGDAGAHALGAALGTAVVASNGRAGLLAHAAAVVAAAAFGDRVSEVARSA